ncbi:MAG: hypothetical protein H7328_08030 [Bdellovibrio sp.]|nr:hypothetical protein [Bdellovibrio sp.]
MMPVQKVVKIYKNAMDLKDNGKSQALHREPSSSEKNNYSDKDPKNSFQSILKKTMLK